ncbi:MAG: hypothetical protein HKP37_08615 [Boseongicola sp.]|nr:hypothetical protein [Boseongicola sp.]
MATLKKLVGDAGAGIDDSQGFDNLYDVLKALAETQNALVAQFNQLLADHNTATDPDSSATAVTAGVTVE